MRDYKEIESEMNRLFDLIEDNPAERKYATSQLKELLNEVESFLIQREMERSVIEELISTKKMILERKQGSQKVRDDAKTDIEDNLEKLRTVKEDIFSFERLRDILDRYLSGTKVFDKYKCWIEISN